MLTLEEKKEKVKDFRPIDDAFFETLADDTAFCEEILRVILNDDKLTVEDELSKAVKGISMVVLSGSMLYALWVMEPNVI